MSGKCAMREVIAIIEKDGKYWIGSNWCNEPQNNCPRIIDDNNYDKCIEVCDQPNHAEIDALINAGLNAVGANLYLIGHEYLCSVCEETVKNFGVKNIIVGELPWKIK
jgi:deoxycytidylate deaminase